MSDEVHFMPAQRSIFRYHDGKQVVSADPLMLRGQLRLASIQSGTTIDKLIDGANEVDLETATEVQIAEGWGKAFMLAGIVKAVFSLDAAADMAHALGVLDAFNRFLEKKNPPTGSPPGSTPPTESISATPATMDTSSALP